VTSPAKTIVIGLDAADRNLVWKWCDSGDLPVLRSLREKGAHGKLISPPGLGDDAAWASFYTAVSPGRHGRYFWQCIEPGSYQPRKFRDDHLKHEPFWNVLSRAGRKTAIIDVPKCPVASDLNGIHLADWQVHGRDHPTRSWPRSAAAAILARFGDDMTDRTNAEWLCRLESLSEDEHETFLAHLLHSIDTKRKMAAEFLEQGNWDLFLLVFKESHCVGHQSWHLLDESHPAHSARLALRLGNPIKRVYQALDTAVGQLLASAGPDTHVIVFSDLGMGPNHTGEYLLDRVLQRIERSRSSVWQRAALAGKQAGHKARARLFGNADSSLSRSARRAFQVEHNEISGAIRINLEGREPAGRVRRGEAYEEFCRSLTRELLDLVNPDNGEPVVESVLRTGEIYRGDHLDRLPDLFVVWSRTAPISAVASPTIGKIRCKDPSYRTGNHVPDGFYVGCGPRAAIGEQKDSASIMDVAPTIAKLLETSLPGTDGKPIAAVCGA
jgi:predicted AlkP superfamily phosphohydrolase/phosphomutase